MSIKQWLVSLATFVTLAFLPLTAALAESSPVGSWRTYDLSRTPRSIVQIYSSGNQLQGQIVKILPTKGGTPKDLCTACKGSAQNKPKQGMVIIWGLTKEGDKWVNGTILDTDSGKTYRCQVSTSPDGRTLYLHAYVGTPLFGKTVNWERAR